MNTDTPQGRTPEQKARKNELARARRARLKAEKLHSTFVEEKEKKEVPEEVENIPIPQFDYQTESEVENDEGTEPSRRSDAFKRGTEMTTPPQEDPEVVRKREIAEKRRASLALARSKIKPKSQITKEKDEEIKRIKEENERLQQEAMQAKLQKQSKPKIIKKYVREKPAPQPQQQPQQQPQASSMDYLAQQSYGEQLQAKLRETMLQKVMMDTFM